MTTLIRPTSSSTLRLMVQISGMQEIPKVVSSLPAGWKLEDIVKDTATPNNERMPQLIYKYNGEVNSPADASSTLSHAVNSLSATMRSMKLRGYIVADSTYVESFRTALN